MPRKSFDLGALKRRGLPRIRGCAPKLRLDGSDYTPTGMQGWSRIVFTRDEDEKRKVMPLEDLLEYLPDWGR